MRDVLRKLAFVLFGAGWLIAPLAVLAEADSTSMEGRHGTAALVFSLATPGVSLEDGITLLVATRLNNESTVEARNVKIRSIRLHHAARVSPPLPLALGDIAAAQSAGFQADFDGSKFEPGTEYVLQVRGTYLIRKPHHEGDRGEAGDGRHGMAGRGREGHEDEDEGHDFEVETPVFVPPAAPGSATVGTAGVPSHSVKGAPFPPRPPSFSDQDNGSRWSVPTGRFVPGTPSPNGTGVLKAPFGDPGAIDFRQNASWGITTGSTIAEPSGASGGGVVFVTSNFFAAYSTNGGATYTQLSPTSIFPADAVGFCCDQIVQYVPSIDRFIWLLQGSGMRLAVASPADIRNSGGTAWTYWNLTPDVFGQPASTGVDYPDLAVGNNSLYLSWDNGWPTCPTGCTSGFQVVRTSLAELQAGGTIYLQYTHPGDSTMAWGSHLVQNTLDEIVWAGHNNNHNIRIFSLAEGSNTYFWRDRDLSSWANSGLSSTTPDGQDWMNKLAGFPGNAVIGGARSGNQVWLGWSAGTDGNFKQPHVEMIELDRGNDFNVLQQVQIWNDSYAFGYPAFAINACTAELGLSLEYGGNGNYENHVVGFWGDFVVYITTGTNAGTTRYGDYVTIRQNPAATLNGAYFDAFGYGLQAVPPPGSGATPDPHYVIFGRPNACQLQ